MGRQSLIWICSFKQRTSCLSKWNQREIWGKRWLQPSLHRRQHKNRRNSWRRKANRFSNSKKKLTVCKNSLMNVDCRASSWSPSFKDDWLIKTRIIRLKKLRKFPERLNGRWVCSFWESKPKVGKTVKKKLSIWPKKCCLTWRNWGRIIKKRLTDWLIAIWNKRRNWKANCCATKKRVSTWKNRLRNWVTFFRRSTNTRPRARISLARILARKWNFWSRI